MGATACVCDRLGESGTSSEERIFGRRKSDLADEAAPALAAFQSGARHLGWDRKAAGAQSTPGGRLRAKPDTILAWYRKLVAEKFDGSKQRQYPGRPPVSSEVTALVVRMAKDNSGWGYDRIVGALANLGHRLSDQTVKNILLRHGIAPAPKRSQITTWKDFLATHMNVMAGADFFTVEVLTWRGLVTYYVLFFLHLESRRVQIAGITRHPDQEWMEQVGRSATHETWGYLHPCRYVLHDRDAKFCESF